MFDVYKDGMVWGGETQGRGGGLQGIKSFAGKGPPSEGGIYLEVTSVSALKRPLGSCRGDVDPKDQQNAKRGSAPSRQMGVSTSDGGGWRGLRPPPSSRYKERIYEARLVRSKGINYGALQDHRPQPQTTEFEEEGGRGGED